MHWPDSHDIHPWSLPPDGPLMLLDEPQRLPADPQMAGTSHTHPIHSYSCKALLVYIQVMIPNGSIPSSQKVECWKWSFRPVVWMGLVMFGVVIGPFELKIIIILIRRGGADANATESLRRLVVCCEIGILDVGVPRHGKPATHHISKNDLLNQQKH